MRGLIGVVAVALSAWASAEQIVDAGTFVSVDGMNGQEALQQALNAVDPGGVVVVPPGTYELTDPEGLRVPRGVTLRLTGATFEMAASCGRDGQAFLVEDAAGVQFDGGTVIGNRDSWEAGVNIAGIRVRGDSHGLRVEGMRFRDLSSNGVGVFGSEDAPITDVQLIDVTTENCCSFYGDYLSEERGPAEGSDREDQGGVAFYHVNDWVVSRCRLLGSQSDGTHFYKSHRGRFVNNEVSGSQMGGYFLEGCEYVIATGNYIARNGSRGVTIERDSLWCILTDNIIEHSGREGLWAPDASGLNVSDNIFRENGRKDDGDKDAEILVDEGVRYDTIAGRIRVSGNQFFTTPSQEAVIRIGAGSRDVVVKGNHYYGGGHRRIVRAQ